MGPPIDRAVGRDWRPSGKSRPAASSAKEPLSRRAVGAKNRCLRRPSWLRAVGQARTDMTVGFKLVLALLSASLLFGGLASPAEAFAAKEPIKLTPHRAVYQMTL